MSNILNNPIQREQTLIDQLEQRPVNEDLSRIKQEITDLSHIDDSRVIQVVGSKGKGSSVHFLTRLLEEMDHSVMAFTSPHFIHPSERFHEDGRTWTVDEFRSRLMELVEGVIKRLSPFELLLYLFLKRADETRPDYLVLEAGMGGRWDATSAVSADCTILTGIEREHVEFLGDTFSEITEEKTAQIRPRSMVVSSTLPAEAEHVLHNRIREKTLTYSHVDPADSPLETMKRLAIRCLYLLTTRDEEFLAKKGKKIEKPPGRQEICTFHQRQWILDVSHTPDSVRALVQFLDDEEIYVDQFVFGLLEGKSVKQIGEIVSKVIPPDNWTVVEPPSPRHIPLDNLLDRLPFDRERPGVADVDELPDYLEERTESGDTILVAGSFPLVAAVRETLIT